MTVEELIEKLKQMPQEAVVVTESSSSCGWPPVCRVEYFPDENEVYLR